MARKKSDYEYSEDVFTLEEEENREQRRQKAQYVVVAVCAALVVALALYGSVVLTRHRMERQESEPVQIDTPVVITPTETLESNYWPAAEFAAVPVFNAEEYRTRSEPGRAEVEVPAQSASAFREYAQALVDQGAKLWIDLDRLRVLMLDGTEIHLIDSNNRTTIVLANEPAYNWNDPMYAAFVRPEAGRMVAVDEGVGADSRVLTWRGVSPLEVLSYTQALSDEGWVLNGTLELNGATFQAVYKKNNLQTTVDYYASGDDFCVRYDFLT